MGEQSSKSKKPKKPNDKKKSTTRKLNRINPKQKVFADEYLKTGNVYQSALTAGYAEKYAQSKSYLMVENVVVKAYLEERLKQIDASRLVSVKEGLEFLSSVVRGEVTDQLGLETPVAERSKAALALIKRQGGLKDQHELEMQQLLRDKARMDIERQRLEMDIARERLELEKQRLELDKLRVRFGDDDDEETGVVALPSVDVETYEAEKAAELEKLKAELGVIE
jgi:phage terminase small subunit